MWEYAKKCVVNEIDFENAINELEDIYSHFTGPDFVIEHFDTLYSILVNFKNASDNDRDILVKLMFKSICLLKEHLETLLGDVNNYAIQDLEERKKECKQLKLNIFVLCTLIDCLEKKSTDTVVNVGRGGKQAANKKKQKESEWDRCRIKIVQTLSKIFTLTLQWLFNPQVVEEDFVICVMNVSWKLFENATNKDKELINSTTVIFGIGIERYKQAFNFKTAVVNLLQNKENLVNSIVQLVDTITKDYNQNQLINDICEEIYEIDKSLLIKNAVGPKSLQTFITDLAEKCPRQFVSAVPSLLLLLDDEPYQLRSGVLSAIGSIVLSELSDENMEEEKQIIRNQLLDKLEEHIYDITSFVRGKSVQVWKRLCEVSKIPLSRVDRVIELIVERLMDKSSYVRKYSIQFLTVFIEVNQFTLKFPNEFLCEIYEIEKAKLDSIVRPTKKNKKEQNTSKIKNSQDNESDDEQNEEDNEEQNNNDKENDENLDKNKENEDVEMGEDEEDKENLDKTLIDENFAPKMDLLNRKQSNVDTNENEGESNLLTYDKQRNVVKYIENCIKIAEQIKIALPRVFSMLYSKNLTDVQEAIDFFVTASEYDVHGSIDGVRRMLGLIFCSEKSVRDALKKAYLRIYMESPVYSNLTLKQKAILVAKRLTILVQDATVGEIASLEELLSQLMAENKIDSKLISILWERFIKSIPNTTPEEARISIHLISMLANSESVIVRQNLDTILDHGLKECENMDFNLVENCCKALEKIVQDRGKIDIKKTPFKLPTDHRLFNRLTELILNHICDFNEDGYVPMCCHVIKVIYLLSEHPNQIAEHLLRSLLKILNEQTETNFDDDNEQTKRSINSELLSRFFYILGEIAQNVMLFIEIDIATEIKKRNQLKTQKTESKTPKRKSMTSKKQDQDNDDDLAEDMGLVGAAADEETEFLNHICNNEIVYKSNKMSNFLAEFAPMITSIASDPIKYSDLHLQTAVCVCLAKFMLVSEKFCTDHLRLFFTILEKTTESTIKINTNICCGDLCIRAPNLLDAWTPKLYLSLRSINLNVRRAAFKVVSRLILADMVKVKEQISEIAKVIVDEDTNLSNMAKLFFVDLAKKNNNAIYNILPDVISHLSNEKVGVNEEMFQIVVKHLFDLIEKEKQTICLTEKLCQRFKIAENEKEWSSLSYCLTLIHISDKSVAKICENISCFSDKLVIDRVYENFSLLINNIKKQTGLKQPTKEMIEEFEKKVEEFRNKGLEKNATKSADQLEEELDDNDKMITEEANDNDKVITEEVNENDKMITDEEN